jgi:hypothetical protein
MKTLQYQGSVPGHNAQCGYLFRFDDRIPTLVLKQDPQATLFLDNSIEAIVTGLLNSELSDVDASRLRVFRMDSKREWAEVRFDTVTPVKVRLTALERLKSIFGSPIARVVEVSGPSWDTITKAQRAMLESLDPQLATPAKSPYDL